MIRSGDQADAEAIRHFDVFGGDRVAALAEGRCLVAECDGRVGGYVVFSPGGLIGRDFVQFLVVDAPLRCRGVATQLLRAVERRVGPGRLFISTEAGNAPMLALLERDGWTAAGQIEGINTSGHAERFFYRDVVGH